MKSIIKFILAAVAVSLALASCAKELLIEENGSASPSEGTRVIAVSFGQQTKTTLNADGITPEFTGEDEWVMVSNEETGEKCQIISENGVLLFKTKLKGDLKAVYPESAATIDKKTNKITGITIPATQTGKFADANICMAENITNKAVFDNKTAILKFYVGEEISVNEISITGSKITGTSNSITVRDSGGKSLHEVTDGPDKRICYVAVQEGVNAKGLQLTSKTTSQGDRSRTLTTAATLEAGKMYNAFIPYYIEVNGVKWGYCNVGAFLPEEPGEYFAWGETIGHKWNASENKFDNGYNFNWTNTPFNGANASFDQTYFNTTKDIVCPNGTLALKYDAANANWGAGWRMPTETDKEKLSGANPKASDGMMIVEGTDLKFPAAGTGSGESLSKVAYGCYWTSSLNTTDDIYAMNFEFYTTTTYFGCGQDRKNGLNIRPVYDETAILKEPVLLPGEFSVNGDGKKVRFTGGNLYWKADNWYIEKNQLDFRTTGDNGVGMFYFSTDATIARTKPYNDSNALIDDKLFCDEDRPLTIESIGGLFCLSCDEWQYLVTGRNTQTNLCARARVNGYNGLLIFPNGYSQGTTVTGTGIGSVNTDKEGFPTENVPSDRWSVMESNGVLFLAIYGFINSNGYFNRDNNGIYWSSSPSTYKTGEAWIAIVNTVRATTSFTMPYYRSYGYPIRLVKNIAQAGK